MNPNPAPPQLLPQETPMTRTGSAALQRGVITSPYRIEPGVNPAALILCIAAILVLSSTPGKVAPTTKRPATRFPNKTLGVAPAPRSNRRLSPLPTCNGL